MHEGPEQLADAWTRLYRAKENYSTLNDEIADFLYEYVKGMVKGWSPETKSFGIQLRHPRERVIGGRPRALVVDILEDLRTALDYMVFELSVLNMPDLNPKTPQFVIADTRKEFDRQSKTRLRYLTDEQRSDFIERLQPFNGNLILGVLRDVTSQSKHRRLLSVRDNTGWDIYLVESTRRDEFEDCFMYPMEKGHTIFARPKKFSIILLGKYDAMSILKAMAEHVGDVVQLCHCFFEGRPFKMNIVRSTDCREG